MQSAVGLPLDASGWPRLEPGTRRQTEAQLVFRSALLQVGRFRARPGEEHFRCSGPPGQHVFVFPRTSVRIRHAGAQPFVTDRERVTFYNPSQLYFREPVSPEGDECDWFALRPDVVRAVAADADPRVEPGSEALFLHAHGPCDRATWLKQRSLLSALQPAETRDAAEIEEEAVELLARLLCAVRTSPVRPRAGPSASRRRDLAEAARETIARRFDRNDSLDEIAGRLGSSVGHLCRVFRDHTGHTLHAHRDELRLRAALDALEDPARRPSELAHELGYASHSHFTAAFRRRFGRPPSRLRQRGVRA